VLGALFGDRRLRQEMTELKARWESLQVTHQGVQERLTRVEEERDERGRQVEALKAENRDLKERLAKAERAQKRPDAPFRRKRRKDKPKKPGRPQGHEPAQRAKPQEVDHEVAVPLTQCPHCGSQDLSDVVDVDPQIVVDLPEKVKPVVTRYHNQSGQCRRCGKRVVSRHRDQMSTARGAAGVQVGPRAVSQAIDLKHRIGIPFRKVCEVLAMLGGIRICAAALVRIGQRIAPRCEPTTEALVQQLRQADVVRADETGWYITQVVDSKPWLWVFTAPEPKITVYCIRLSRGIEVPLEVLGEEFVGTLGVDGWAGYLNLPYDKGQCVAHLLRRCWSLLEVNKQGAARFPLQVNRLLGEACAIKALAPTLDPADYRALGEQMHGALRAILEADIQQPLNLKFQKHMVRHQDELLTFLEVPGMDPSNNLAEQEIRPAVVLRKISAGNRTLEGAYVHEHLASLSRTAQRNGIPFVTLLPQLLTSTDPNLILPVLPIWQIPPPPAPS
jgi:transposase